MQCDVVVAESLMTEQPACLAGTAADKWGCEFGNFRQKISGNLFQSFQKFVKDFFTLYVLIITI